MQARCGRRSRAGWRADISIPRTSARPSVFVSSFRAARARAEAQTPLKDHYLKARRAKVNSAPNTRDGCRANPAWSMCQFQEHQPAAQDLNLKFFLANVRKQETPISSMVVLWHAFCRFLIVIKMNRCNAILLQRPLPARASHLCKPVCDLVARKTFRLVNGLIFFCSV